MSKLSARTSTSHDVPVTTRSSAGFMTSSNSFSVPAPSFLLTSAKSATAKGSRIQTVPRRDDDFAMGVGGVSIRRQSESGNMRDEGEKPVGTVQTSRRRRTQVSLTEAERLEIENKKMEHRLALLKENLAKQKEKRGAAESIWKAGNTQLGSLNAYAGDVLQAKARAKNQKSRYTGLAEEASREHYALTSQVSTRLKQLQTLHTQNTGAEGLPRDLNHLPVQQKKDSVAAGGSDAGISADESDASKLSQGVEQRILVGRKFELVSDEVAKSAEEPQANHSTRMWQIPAASATETILQPHPPSTNTLSSTFLMSLQSWTSTAAVAPAVPLSTDLPSHPSTPLRIRKSRLKPVNINERTSISCEAPVNVISSGELLKGEYDEKEGRKEFLKALNEWRGCDSEVNEEAGMLLKGEFDEGKSRRGFLEALEEWRSGEKGSKDGKSNVGEESIATSTFDTYSIYSKSANQQNTIGILLQQFENSSTSMSYFDKLRLIQYRQARDIKSSGNACTELVATDEMSKSSSQSSNDDSEDFAAQVFWPVNSRESCSRKADWKIEHDINEVSLGVRYEFEVLKDEEIVENSLYRGFEVIVEEPNEESSAEIL